LLSDASEKWCPDTTVLWKSGSVFGRGRGFRRGVRRLALNPFDAVAQRAWAAGFLAAEPRRLW